MTAPTLSQFEDALLARLDTAKIPNGPFRQVKAHQGDLGKIVKDRTVDGPAVFVHLDSSEEEAHTTHTFRREVEIHIFLAVLNYRGMDQARKGTSTEPGVFGCLDQVRDLLAGASLGLEIQPLTPAGFHSLLPPEAAMQGPLAVYRYDWKTRWMTDRPALEPDAALHTTSRVELDHQIDGDADLQTWVTHP